MELLPGPAVYSYGPGSNTIHAFKLIWKSKCNLNKADRYHTLLEKPVKQIQVVIISIALYQLANKRNTSVVIDEKRSILTMTLAPKITVRVSIFIETVSQIFYLPGRSISLHYAWAEIVLFLSSVRTRRVQRSCSVCSFGFHLAIQIIFYAKVPRYQVAIFAGLRQRLGHHNERRRIRKFPGFIQLLHPEISYSQIWFLKNALVKYDLWEP